MLNTETYKVEIKANQTTKQAVVNKKPTGTFTLTKENADGSAKIAGVPYRIWSADGSYDKVHTTSNAGTIKVEGLKLRIILLSRTE